jgi:hypothetical protein
MIRKMLVIAAAVAMPAAALAGIAGGGVASAVAKPPPSVGSCAITGAVTFAAPGITFAGTITNKTSEKSASVITPSSFCGTKVIKEKIPSATTACWSTLPTYSKTAPLGGILATSPAAAASCDVGGASASSDSNVVAADVKIAVKDQFYFDDAPGFVSGGVTSIQAALSKGVKVTNNGNNGLITVTGASAVTGTGGSTQCGSGIPGFEIDGTTAYVGAGHAVVDICLSGDTGSGTTNNFTADLLGGTATIVSGTIGGESRITYTA